MTTRRVKFKANTSVSVCPKCGNNTEFVIHSRQVAEDCCEVWAQCKCGHEHGSEHNFEDVMGGVHDENVQVAMGCWNEACVETN